MPPTGRMPARPPVADRILTISGSICALITPFTDDGAPDEAALTRLVEHHIQGGTKALVVAGSTGEAAMLEDGEYARLLERTVELVKGRIPVLAGTGAAGTTRTVRLTRLACAQGVDAALVAVPSYVRPGQEGLYRHYMAVAEQGGLPVMLYNGPGRTACDLMPETVARLAPHPNIIGIKEALADAGRMQALLELQDRGFSVLSGDDPTALAALRAGARGVISVAANVVPALMAALCEHALAGRDAQAGELDAALQDLYRFLGVESNPIPAKWLCHRLGLCQPRMRLPLTTLAAQWHDQGDRLLATLAGLADPGT